jgi:prepilin-type processing-associated H-X9-DG protein
MEQSSLYNTFNTDVHYFYDPNTTISAVGISTHWCPSDPTIQQTTITAPFDDPDLSFPQPTHHISYMGNAGSWLNPGRFQGPTCFLNPSPFASLLANANGMIYFYSAVSIADVTDGTSNTVLLGEVAYGVLDANDQTEWHWWTSGNYGDSIYTHMYPLNPFNRINTRQNEPIFMLINSDIAVLAASSMHPGGANFAFADGSVKFLKDTIQTLPWNPYFGFVPTAYSYTNGIWSCNAPMAVYQALSTRNGGEVISADAY